jgi:hypothetical protein
MLAHDLITGLLPLDVVPVVLARPASRLVDADDEPTLKRPDTYPFRRG